MIAFREPESNLNSAMRPGYTLYYGKYRLPKDMGSYAL